MKGSLGFSSSIGACALGVLSMEWHWTVAATICLSVLWTAACIVVADRG